MLAHWKKKRRGNFHENRLAKVSVEASELCGIIDKSQVKAWKWVSGGLRKFSSDNFHLSHAVLFNPKSQEGFLKFSPWFWANFNDKDEEKTSKILSQQTQKCSLDMWSTLMMLYTLQEGKLDGCFEYFFHALSSLFNIKTTQLILNCFTVEWTMMTLLFSFDNPLTLCFCEIVLYRIKIFLSHTQQAAQKFYFCCRIRR